MGGMWHYLLRRSCRQSMDVSMSAKARRRVRSAHGSPLSDTTSSSSCTPARKARPPSSTCGRQIILRGGKHWKQSHHTHQFLSSTQLTSSLRDRSQEFPNSENTISQINIYETCLITFTHSPAITVLLFKGS